MKPLILGPVIAALMFLLPASSSGMSEVEAILLTQSSEDKLLGIANSLIGEEPIRTYSTFYVFEVGESIEGVFKTDDDNFEQAEILDGFNGFTNTSLMIEFESNSDSSDDSSSDNGPFYYQFYFFYDAEDYEFIPPPLLHFDHSIIKGSVDPAY
ncbi:hypothetical protein EOPP23_12670 [Endozoicomonas sp. OPT23]|uniref:hypothetical protein n=1 Tax=Endozoicomonas sp. OPT23 TaxID=2072845 RepID=UPI00129AC951|nr:hypothetical protein [Endozoicomonas sp. OPT23]MRI33840.1 hypothetical protein [Endozoicomonas sp. OPT23]